MIIFYKDQFIESTKHLNALTEPIFFIDGF